MSVRHFLNSTQTCALATRKWRVFPILVECTVKGEAALTLIDIYIVEPELSTLLACYGGARLTKSHPYFPHPELYL
jgi:hypothetical protein